LRQLPDSDWKLLRQVALLALERFCQQTLEKVARMAAGGDKSYRQRYLAIYDLIRRRDKELAAAFNDMRRSTAFYQLAHIYSMRLLRDEEFLRFSPETRAALALLLGEPDDSQ
jgi:hypothetical protein